MKKELILITLLFSFLASFGQTTAEEYFNQGSEKLKSQNFKEALIDYNKAIELNPKYGKAYNDRGFVKIYLADLDGALSDFNTAIEINPNQEEPYFNRGIAKAKLKDYKGSIVDY